MKLCKKCGVAKPVGDFYKGDGSCKECRKAYARSWYRDTKDQRVAYERARSKRADRRANAIKYQKHRRAAASDKYKARTAVGNALRDGRLKKLPCERCGAAKSQAHHDDYSKPLDVRWLCFVHHREHHGQVVVAVNV